MKILTTPDPFLRKTAKKVEALTPKDLAQLAEMFIALKNARDPKGVGLAATQVGIDKQIFMLLEGRRLKVFINPVIIKKSKKMFSAEYPDLDDRWLEGCLSIPKIWGFVDRPFSVTLRYQTIDRSLKNPTISGPIKEVFQDIESAYVQHETDHLNGILFTDHLLKQKGQIFQEIKGKLQPIELPV